MSFNQNIIDQEIPFDEIKSNLLGARISNALSVIYQTSQTNKIKEKDFTDIIQKIVVSSIEDTLKHYVIKQVDSLVGENLNFFLRNWEVTYR